MDIENFVNVYRQEGELIASWGDEVFDFIFAEGNEELAEKASHILDALGDFWNEIVEKNLNSRGVE